MVFGKVLCSLPPGPAPLDELQLILRGPAQMSSPSRSHSVPQPLHGVCTGWLSFCRAASRRQRRVLIFASSVDAKHRCPVYVCGIQCLIESCTPASSFHFVRAWSALLGSFSISQSKELTRIPWRFNGVAA